MDGFETRWLKIDKINISLSYVDATLSCKHVHMCRSRYLSHIDMKEDKNLEVD